MGDRGTGDYYGHVRGELFTFAVRVRELTGRVLNVGCGAGTDADILRAMGATHVEGVEPSVAAQLAATRYDRVFEGQVEQYVPQDKFDVIIMADVLEHLVEPGELLERTREWLNPGGYVLISVPNVRHISVLWQLVIRGEWRYVDAGILDATHLRFFTLRSFLRLLENSGFLVVSQSFNGSSSVSRAVVRLAPQASRFLQSQLFFVAHPSKPACHG